MKTGRLAVKLSYVLALTGTLAMSTATLAYEKSSPKITQPTNKGAHAAGDNPKPARQPSSKPSTADEKPKPMRTRQKQSTPSPAPSSTTPQPGTNGGNKPPN